jgi:hypothetical protein
MHSFKKKHSSLLDISHEVRNPAVSRDFVQEVLIGIVFKHVKIDEVSQNMLVKMTINVKMSQEIFDNDPTFLVQDEDILPINQFNRPAKKLGDLVSVSHSCQYLIPCTDRLDISPFDILDFEFKIKVNSYRKSSGEQVKLTLANRKMKDLVQFQRSCLRNSWSVNGLISLNSMGKELSCTQHVLVSPDNECTINKFGNEDTIIIRLMQESNTLENLSKTWFPAFCIIVCGMVLSNSYDSHPEEYAVDLLMTVVFMTRSKFGASTALIYFSAFSSAMANLLFHNLSSLRNVIHVCSGVLLSLLLILNCVQRAKFQNNKVGYLCRCADLSK